mgnify:CR=1 FL=1
MAITFQEKSNLGERAVVLLVLLAMLGAAVFFGWNFIKENSAPLPALPAAAPAINVEVLQDPRLAEMEMFPRISLPEEEITRENPFAEFSATTTADTGDEE